MNTPPTGRLDHHVPGQSVVAELLALRGSEAQRSTLARLFGADPLTRVSLPWYQGALGEVAVGRILARLGPEWTVLHAVPVGSGASDIDHVLIGPAGVFTLNTKNHDSKPVWVAGRTLMVSGRKQRHIPNSAHEAERAARLLTAAVGAPVAATGLVVVVGAKSLTVRERPTDVVVLTDRQLLRWLARREPVLPMETVRRIADAAAVARTWHRDPSASADPGRLAREFDLLHRMVVRARRRRSAWALTATATIATFVLGVLPALLASAR